MASFARARQLMAHRRLPPGEAPLLVAHAKGQATGFQSTIAVARPPETIEGDLLIAVMNAAYNRSWSGDTGFAESFDQGANPGLRMAWKLAGAAEPGSYTFSASGGGNPVVQILCLRHAAIDAVGALATSADAGPLAMPQVAGAGGLLLAVVASSGSTSRSHAAPAGMALVDLASFNQCFLSTFVEAIGPGATGSRSSTIGGGVGNNAGVLIAIGSG